MTCARPASPTRAVTRYRRQVQGWLLQFREALESQDSQRVERHRRELGRALDELEGLQ